MEVSLLLLLFICLFFKALIFKYCRKREDESKCSRRDSQQNKVLEFGVENGTDKWEEQNV